MKFYNILYKKMFCNTFVWNVAVDNMAGEKLEFSRVDRKQMGAYLCIASNAVPPAVSKRVYLAVNCK